MSVCLNGRECEMKSQKSQNLREITDEVDIL